MYGEFGHNMGELQCSGLPLPSRTQTLEYGLCEICIGLSRSLQMNPIKWSRTFTNKQAILGKWQTMLFS